MIRHLFIFFLFILFGFLYFYADSKEKPAVDIVSHIQNENFVYIKENKFHVQGKPFFLLAINFMASMHINDTSLWPSMYPSYTPQHEYHNTNKDSCYNELLHNFVFIKDLGFNTVRISGIGEAKVENPLTGMISFKCIDKDGVEKQMLLDSEDKIEKYLNAIAMLLEAAEDAGLKVIFTLMLSPEAISTEEHFKKIATRFKDNPTILAYDLFNEPQYFDNINRQKSEVYRFTNRWKMILKSISPDQLCTIGLASQREVLEWDPNIVDVDFISFHPYEYEPDMVRNELYWYKRFVNKPWIIGETGVPSDNDSIPYDEQLKFAQKTILQTINCGSMGYSWWQYKDVEWNIYHQNYLGIMNQKGESKNSRGRMVNGTPKPVTESIRNLNPMQEKSQCECPKNYYNYLGLKDFCLKGKVVDENNKPIEGAGIVAWEKTWNFSYFTSSKPDGSFELYGNFKFYNWMISSVGNYTVQGDFNPDSSKIYNGVPTINLGNVQLKPVLLQ